MRMITPRQGDADYPKSKRLQDRALSRFSKDPRAHGNNQDARIACFKEFFESQGITWKDVLKLVILRNLRLNPDFEDLRKAFSGNEEAQIDVTLPVFMRDKKVLLTIATGYILKMYRDVHNLRISSFECLEEESEEETMGRLIDALKQDGPMFVAGYFGQPYYSVPAKKVNDPIVRQCFGWTHPRNEEANDYPHAVAICGAASFKDHSGKLQHRVYFIDPNDPSDPSRETHRKVYAMSVKNFRKFLTPCERLKLPLTEENCKPCYGIQRKLGSVSEDEKLERKGDEPVRQTNEQPVQTSLKNSCPFGWRRAAEVAVALFATAVGCYFMTK
jgi:hypothetical protein